MIARVAGTEETPNPPGKGVVGMEEVAVAAATALLT